MIMNKQNLIKGKERVDYGQNLIKGKKRDDHR